MIYKFISKFKFGDWKCNVWNSKEFFKKKKKLIENNDKILLVINLINWIIEFSASNRSQKKKIWKIEKLKHKEKNNFNKMSSPTPASPAPAPTNPTHELIKKMSMVRGILGFGSILPRNLTFSSKNNVKKENKERSTSFKYLFLSIIWFDVWL